MFRNTATVLTAGLSLLLAGSVMAQTPGTTTTPIQHLVVIFDENISFDHYFGAYPNALNPQDEPVFTPSAGTPVVNGFTPGVKAAAGPVAPFRLESQPGPHLRQRQPLRGMSKRLITADSSTRSRRL